MIQNTQEVKKNVFYLDKTGQNVQIFKDVLFFQATYKKQSIYFAYVSLMLDGWQKEMKE